jgi:spermidine synthase
MYKKKSEVKNENLVKEKDLSSFFLYSIAFIEGSIVIFLELLGAKLIQAYYGNSLLVWSIVICVTISSLTLGYFIGGKLSKRTNKVKILAILFALAAFFTCIMPVWIYTLLEKYGDIELLSATLYTSIFLLAPGIITLGATTPIIIQLLSDKNGEAGKSAGNIYAISTVAGILSTILLGFYIMPNVGTKIPLIIAAFILILISFFIKYTKIWIASIIVMLFFSYSHFSKKEEKSLINITYTSEGLMGQLKVVDQAYTNSTEKFRSLVINGIPQTIIFNNDNTGKSFWEYAYKISATASLKKGGKALLFGMGGGAIANELQHLDFELDIVDIDQRMYDIAQKYFYFKPRKSTTFTVDDARHYIKTHKKKYDFIMLDICTGEVQPSNVFTKEGIAELKKLINHDGIIVIQYQEKVNPKVISGSKSIAKTFNENGFYSYENIESGEIDGILIANTLYDVDFLKIDTTKLTPLTKKSNIYKEFLEMPYKKIAYNNKNAILLFDDKPLLEKINANTIEEWRKIMIKNYGLKIY